MYQSGFFTHICGVRLQVQVLSPEACLTGQVYETENVLLHRGKLLSDS